MVDDAADGESACIGYAEFCARMENDSTLARWLAPLSTDIKQLATVGAPLQSRLVALQRNLIDLIDILDPEFIRFPDRRRRKLHQYNVVIRKDQPCCLILLVDQSSSTNQRIAGTTIRKRDAIADTVNSFLYEAVLRCVREHEVRDYFYVGAFIHGAGKRDVESAFGEDFVPISKLAGLSKPPQQRFAHRTRGDDRKVQQPIELPIWFEPVAAGRAIMKAAFDRALVAAKKWARQHPDSYPPIVVNITGGSSSGKDVIPLVTEIKELANHVGNTLVFNCHLSDIEREVIAYAGPSRATNLGELAHQLYLMSSVLPEPMFQEARLRGDDLEPGARGYILNTDAASVIDLLQIGTRALAVSELTDQSE
jgi:hypothetical protein